MKEAHLYEGLEKYVFISYCHKDKDIVFPVIEKLAEEGYRVWYDQGIHPGSEWPEIVAQHLNNSYIFMAFVSENYVQSQNCIREIHFAVAKQKELLSIILEPVVLTPGVEMQLCTSQALKKYEYKDEEIFYRQLFSSMILEECCEKESVCESGKEETAKEVSEDEHLVEKSKQKKVKQQNPKKKGRGKKIAFVTALIIVLVIIGKMIYQKLDMVELAGVEYSKKTSDFEFKDKAITAEMMEKLQVFENVNSLKFVNCEFKKGALKKLGELEELMFLDFDSCKGVKDLSFLNSMKGLFSLSVINCGLDDSSFKINETMENLEELTIMNNPGVTECEWISYMPELFEITMTCNGITDMTPVANLEEVMFLDLSDNQIQDASMQVKSLRLHRLNLANNKVTDFSGLSDLTVLEQVYLGGNQYVEKEGNSLEFLKKSEEVLEYVDLSGNDFTPETFKNLAGCVNLKELYIDGNKRVGSLEFLQNISTLEILSASGCEISSLKGMEGNIHLDRIDLSDNQLETLEYFPEIEDVVYVDLFLNGNKLTDISTLSEKVEYDTLLLYGNKLDAVSSNVLSELEGSQLGITYVDGMFPNVAGGFSKVYVDSVPADKRVSWEDGHYGCEFGIIDKEGNVEEQ